MHWPAMGDDDGTFDVIWSRTDAVGTVEAVTIAL
jgi:hypothetical protein